MASYWFVNRISKWREVHIYISKYFGHLSKGLGERTWFCLSRSPKEDCEFLSLKMMDLGVGNVPRTAVPTCGEWAIALHGRLLVPILVL